MSTQYINIVLLALLGTTLSQNPGPTATAPKDQYGDLICETNAQGIMVAELFIFKNNSMITMAHFVQSDFNRYTDPECQWSGTGSLSDPFKATVYVDPNTDLTPVGNDNCGHTVVRQGEAYEWMVYTQIFDRFHNDGNVIFYFRCNKFGLPSVLSTSVTDTGRPVLEIPSTIGSLSLDLVRTTSATSPLVTTIAIGTDFYMRLRLQPTAFLDTSNIDISLVPWGAYCERIYVTPDNNYEQRKTQLIDGQGCPNPDIGLTRAFEGLRPAQFGDLFFSYAGPQEAWRFDKTATYPSGVPNTVHFVCEARLCWRPEDTNCIDRCATDRKKRSTGTSVTDHEGVYIIRATLTIEDEDDDAAEPASSSGDINTFISIIAGASGFVIVVLCLLVVFFVCLYRRKQRRSGQRDTSSASSLAFAIPNEKHGGLSENVFRHK